MFNSQKSLQSVKYRAIYGSESSDYHSTNEYSSESTSFNQKQDFNASPAFASPQFTLRDRCYSFKKSAIQKYHQVRWISRLPKRMHPLIESNHGLGNLLFRPGTQNGPVFNYVAVPDSNISAHHSQKLKQRTSSYCIGEQLVMTTRVPMSTGFLNSGELQVDYPSSPLSIEPIGVDQKWIGLRESLLNHIKERLSRDNMFKIKEGQSNNMDLQEVDSEGTSSPSKISAAGANFTVRPQMEVKLEVATVANLLSNFQSSSELVFFCTDTKENSLSVQQFLEQCSRVEISKFGRLFEAHYGELITHRIGNYILKKLVELDPVVTLPMLAEYCHLRFTSLMKNEYSGRVIQSLIEACPLFRRRALEFFSDNFSECLENTAVVFLIISAIRCSPLSSETSFVKGALRQNPNLLGIKVFQRVLVSYVQNCDEACLEEVSSLINPEVNLRRLLNEKFSTYIILTLLQRKVDLITHILLRSIRTDIEELFETKFFKLLISKLFELKDERLTETISKELTSFTSSQLFHLASRSSYFLFYLYISFSSFGEGRIRNFVKFYKRLSSYPTLKPFLNVKQSASIQRH